MKNWAPPTPALVKRLPKMPSPLLSALCQTTTKSPFASTDTAGARCAPKVAVLSWNSPPSLAPSLAKRWPKTP